MCSHEIAASTAQLVAASKVGPGPDSLGRRKPWLGLRYLDQGLAPRTDDLSRVQAGWVSNSNFGSQGSHTTLL